MGCGLTFIFLKLVVIFLEFSRQSVKAVPNTQLERIIDYDILRNVVFLKSGEIILAGDRMLYKLEANLSLIEEKSMCDPGCENINKICLAREKHGDFIICGTRNDGFCEMRFVADLSEVSTNDSAKTLPKIPNQKHIYSVAFIDDNSKLVLGYNTTDDGNFTYKITEIELSSLSPGRNVSLGSEPYSAIQPLIYFKKVLPNISKKNRNYFLIHERNTTNYNSKMVIMCESGFTKVNINCTRDNKNYNLIQDADIFESGTSAGMVFVGAFVSSDNPLSVSGDSVVCIQELNLIDKQMQTFSCSDINRADVPLKSSYLLPKSEGFITAIMGFRGPQAKMSVVYIGTSKGSFIQTYLTSLGEPLQSFSSTVVQEGSPVVTMKSHNNGTYVVTGKKIAWYSSTNCESYKTCNEMTKAKNPFCGWCIFEGRSTARSECNSSWTSMVEPCSSISVSFGTQRVEERQQLRIQTENFPLDDIQSGDNFTCRLSGNEQSGSVAAYNSTSKNFTCTIQEKKHQITTLEVVGTRSGKEFLVGAIEYLIYKCEHFKRCGQCTDNRIQCQWCLESCHDSCLNMTVCPKLADREIYVPNGFDSNVTFYVDIPNSYSVSCHAPSISKPCPCTSNGTSATCSLKITMMDHNTSKQDLGILLKYGLTSPVAELDKEINVTVYRCDLLAYDCTHCQALNLSRYQCQWDNTTGACVAGPRNNVQCPSANITEVSPLNAPVGGMTFITIYGTNFNNSTPITVTVAGFPCSHVNTTTTGYPDFQEQVIDSISCWCSDSSHEASGPVNITIGSSTIAYTEMFEYKLPNITDVSPKSGLGYVGTVMTFSGRNLVLGNRKIKLRYNNVAPISNCSVVDRLTLKCTLSVKVVADMTLVRAYFDDGIYEFRLNYSIINDPIVNNVSSKMSILSGGTALNISGINITNAGSYAVDVLYNGFTQNQVCENASSTLLQCRFPPAPPNLRRDLDVKLNHLNQSQRGLMNPGYSCQCIEASIIIKLDGYEKSFPVFYYPDPSFENFSDVQRFSSEEKYITIRGSSLDLVVTLHDIKVTVGVKECSELVLQTMNITCKIPEHLQIGIKHFVVVYVGGTFEQQVGYVLYDAVPINPIFVIAGIVSGVVALLAIAVAAIIFGVYRMKKKVRNNMEIMLHAMEMEAANAAQLSSFLALMDKIVTNQTIPYHGYQKFILRVLFPSIQNDQHRRPKRSAAKGLAKLEKLILCEEFMVALVTHYDNDDRFSHMDRSSLASSLCVVLMGNMGYLNEVLKILLTRMVQEAMTARKHKTLFQRCESTTDYILCNWLCLTMYPYFKCQSDRIGSHLYHLVMATRMIIENGPIDAITNDAQFTLREDKLFRHSTQQIGCRNGAKQLTLNVVVNKDQQVYSCIVLDCDTISQVKTKCISQIYVNQPVTQFDVHHEDLQLNWHRGNTSPLTLLDEDISSIRHGNLLKLNTLAHYRVPDGANVTLVDPETIDQNGYCRLDLVHEFPIQEDSMLNGAKNNTSKWHLVKPMADWEKKMQTSTMNCQDTDKISTTKQSLNEYLATFFDHILDSDHCPPPAKFICDYMDILASAFKIDDNTLFAWKSKSYVSNFWGRMIRQPNHLFDIHVPQYVEDSLDVIAQVLNDSLAPSSQQLSEKTVFQSEVESIRKKAKEFFARLHTQGAQDNVLAEYLEDVNKLQQQQSFSKTAYLKRFFDQLTPHLDQIKDHLSSDVTCTKHEIDRKMQEVIDFLR